MVEKEVKNRLMTEESKIKDPQFEEQCGFENSDITIEEVEAAIAVSSCNSAPSPEEQIFYIYLKKGGDAVVRGIHYIIQKRWTRGSFQKPSNLILKLCFQSQENQSIIVIVLGLIVPLLWKVLLEKLWKGWSVNNLYGNWRLKEVLHVHNMHTEGRNHVFRLCSGFVILLWNQETEKNIQY